MKKCVFFDRDGIVNESPGPGYVESWEAFRLVPEFGAALEVAHAAGYVAVIVTNQRGIALGCMSANDVEEIHARLRKCLRAQYGTDVLEVRYCPHDNNQCECRKPLPGMLLESARRHDIDLASSWMIGDSERDIEAGRAAGCRTIRVGGLQEPSQADHRVASMAGLVGKLRMVLEGADCTGDRKVEESR